MKPKHTPGPWSLNKQMIVAREQECQVATITSAKAYAGPKTNEVSANAHLITNAPEMLTALKHVNEVLFNSAVRNKPLEMIVQEMWDYTNAIIAKAEGDE